jgi:hypothetical protein
MIMTSLCVDDAPFYPALASPSSRTAAAMLAEKEVLRLGYQQIHRVEFGLHSIGEEEAKASEDIMKLNDVRIIL